MSGLTPCRQLKPVKVVNACVKNACVVFNLGRCNSEFIPL